MGGKGGGGGGDLSDHKYFTFRYENLTSAILSPLYRSPIASSFEDADLIVITFWDPSKPLQASSDFLGDTPQDV